MKRAITVDTYATNLLHRSDTLQRYYEDVRKFNLCTREEEVKLFNKVKFGSKCESDKAKEQLINKNQRIVIAIAKRYANNDNILDLINEGNIGLMESIDKFDISRDVCFSSFAVWFIRRQIRLYAITTSSCIKKSNLQKTYHMVSKVTNKFAQRECRYPTVEEIQDEIGKEYDVDIKDNRDLLDARVTYIDEGLNGESEDETNLGDMFEFNRQTSSLNNYETDNEKEFVKEIIKSSMNRLTPREKEIITLSFGIDGNKEYNHHEIAEKLDLTSERIRQIKKAAMEKMRHEIRRLNYKI